MIVGQENETEEAPKEEDETPIPSVEDSPKEMEDTPREGKGEVEVSPVAEAKLEDTEDVEVDEGERRSGTCDDCKPAALSGTKFNEIYLPFTNETTRGFLTLSSQIDKSYNSQVSIVGAMTYNSRF